MKFFEEITKYAFEEKDIVRKNLYLSLLDKKRLINNKFINIEYKFTTDIQKKEQVMLILTDISEKHDLEIRMQEIRNILNMTVNVVKNYDLFINCIKCFNNFHTEIVYNILCNNDSLEKKVFEIYRNIHTFKGNFSMFSFTNIVKKLHNFENNISSLKDLLSTLTLNDIVEFVKIQNMSIWLDDDMKLLKEHLGESFIKEEGTIIFEKNKLLELEQRIINIVTPEHANLLLNELKKLRYKPFCDLLNGYSDYILDLAGRLDKLVNPLVIKGGNIQVDYEKYYPFTKSIIHILKNIIDHGIESSDERIAKGKSGYGNICCTIELTKENMICIKISDDGRGINIQKLAKRAIEKGLYEEHEIQNFTANELANLIFVDDLSTSDYVTQSSGRGMGLSSVKEELERINGIVQVITKTDIGTEFHFMLPYHV